MYEGEEVVCHGAGVRPFPLRQRGISGESHPLRSPDPEPVPEGRLRHFCLRETAFLRFAAGRARKYQGFRASLQFTAFIGHAIIINIYIYLPVLFGAPARKGNNNKEVPLWHAN
ncbi:MAG: hypothetical protein IKN89_05070 [Oscillospiraceae bacterium]|nr:hypothetical protein [Oscillospiraceae bacterium]